MHDETLDQLRKLLRGKTFGERLRWFRETKNLRQIDIADAALITTSEISDYELNKQVPNPGTLLAIADALDLTQEERFALVEPLLAQPIGSLAGHMHSCRLVRGLTQEQVSNKIGISTGVISNLEQGKTIPHPETLHMLFQMLRVSRSKRSHLLWQDCVNHSHSAYASQLQLTRLRNGLSVEKLSELCDGIGVSTILQYESGTVPQAEKFNALAKTLFQQDQTGRYISTKMKFDKWYKRQITLLLGEELATVGGQLKFWRYYAGMPLGETAALIDVTPGYVSQWETNRKLPPQDKFDALAKSLSIPDDAEIHSMLSDARKLRRGRIASRPDEASCVSTEPQMSRPILGHFTQLLRGREAGRGIGFAHE